MPVREHVIGDFTQYSAPEVAKPSPTLGETWRAAFSLENDVLNAAELLTKPTFTPNPMFNVTQKLKDTKFWDSHRDNFLGVKSDEEFNYVAGQIEQEDHERDVLMRAGWGGTIAAMGAGLLSPTTFIPLLGPARGVKGVAQAFALGAVAGVAQEVPLLANQQTRTLGEAAFSVGASTVLNGILGSAVLALRKGEFEALEAGMANSPRAIAISPTGSSVGAAVAEVSAGTVKGKAARGIAKVTDSNPITRNPVTDNIMSDFETARWTTAQLSDSGLTMEKNAAGIPTSLGGTVENNITPWYGRFSTYVETADDAYNRYVFDGNVPTVAPNQRAWIRGLAAKDKLSKSEFREQVWHAMANGDSHENKFVAEAAKAARKEVYDPILKELQAVKLLGDELPESADQSYINWVPDHGAISANPTGFIDFLAERYNKKLQEQFGSMMEKYRLGEAREEELLSDLARPQDEIDRLRDVFGEQLKALDERANAQQFTALEDTISALRAAARPLKDGSLLDETTRKQMLADAKAMEEAAGQPLQDIKLERRELKRRLSNLNKAQVVLEERLAKKLDKIERSEELSMNTLNRAARAGYKFLSEMENWTDAKLDAELSKLRTQFEQTARVYDKGEERLVKLANEGEPDADVLAGAAQQELRADKMTVIAERIADAEDLGREALRDMINDMLQESLAKIQRINSRRAVRTQKLRAQAEALDPKLFNERISGIKAKRAEREMDFGERIRVMGGDLDVRAGKADFTTYARDAATKTKDKFLGTNMRLPVVDMMQAERGAVLPRLLGFIPTKEMAPWLERDIEKVMKTHLRTMAPDIEITRKLGSVNGEEQWVKLTDELNAKLENVKNAVDSKGKPRSPEWQQKETLRIQEEFGRVKNNLEGIIKRLRHQWGVPTNPDGAGYRMANTVMDLNVLRYMGGVTWASIPDLGRPIMRYGLTRTFRDGFVPMITNLKGMRLAAQEARRFGVGIDVLTNARAQGILDITDDLQRGSKFERGVQYLAGKQGIIAAFNYWTDAMKGLTANIANAKMFDSIADVMNGTNNVKDAVEFLASNGIGAATAERIWKQVGNGGAAKVDGVWLPNTEAWTDDIARRSFQQAVAREANNTIVTPGVERPLWVNSSTTGRMIAQFKSFGFSSTSKTLQAGLQQNDMAFATGVTISLALGALSYYVSSIVRGGQTYERMMNADVEDWADEAYQRSGILGVFGLGQDLLSRIPSVAPYVSFSGGRSTRRGGDDLIEAALGPSFDAAKTAADVLSGIDDPTKSTLHKVRELLPWQNTHLIGALYSAIEQSANLKEHR